MSQVETFCTDIDILTAVGNDYINLCPRHQMLTAGGDGAFAADSRWLLSSASQAFESLGIGVGNVVWLSGPLATYRPPGEMLSVAAVAPEGITLARVGMQIGVLGVPPGPAGGLSGVTFSAPTFYPQREAAAFEIGRVFNLDEYRGVAYSSLYNPRDLRAAAVAYVLFNQYMAMSSLPTADMDTFMSKSEYWKTRYETIMSGIKLRVDTPSGPQTLGRFCRVER